MQLELLYKIENVCDIPKGFGMGQAFTELAVKILFDDFSGFDEKRWTIILPEKQIYWILYLTWIMIS